jgi:hypothetical protein
MRQWLMRAYKDIPVEQIFADSSSGGEDGQ